MRMRGLAGATLCLKLKIGLKTMAYAGVEPRYSALTPAPLISRFRPTVNKGSNMSDAPDPERMTELERKLEKARKAQEPEPRQETHVTQLQGAWRMVIDLVAGVGIGFGIGYGLDSLFGTIPIFLVLFILLGLAAGVRTMMRTAEELQTNASGNPAQDQRPDGQGKR